VTYAHETNVPVAKSRAEIEQLVRRAGAHTFGVMETEGTAQVIFAMKDRRVMFELPLPTLSSFSKKTDRRGFYLNDAKKRELWEQACRSPWRALCLAIKAKLVSVEAGVETFEEAFLAQVVVVNDGREQRFGTIAQKAIAESYTRNALPPLLGSGT
jgi:hypothetical protein